jgi:predicted transcriptional regulator
MDKRYYWFKLHEYLYRPGGVMRIIAAMPDGRDFIYLYHNEVTC